MNNSTNFTSSHGESKVDLVDFIVILVYFILCIAVGIWATCRTQRGTVSGYFLAGRETPWYAVGASLFATNLGSGLILGQAGTSATSGIAVASYELNGLFEVLLLAWVFVPVYISSGVYTLPEYLKKRFGGERLQTYMAVLTIVMAVLIKLSSDIYAGAVFITQAFGWNMYVGVAILLAVTTIYTVAGYPQCQDVGYTPLYLTLVSFLAGGLKAVIYTDTLQTIVLLLGCSILSGVSFYKIGGMSMLYEKYMVAIPHPLLTNSGCGLPRADSFHLLRDAKTGDLPWPGNIFGIFILGSWFFCSEQVLVQRCLAAKNLHHVKGGAILTAYLKTLPLFIVTFPGMISRVLFPDEVACVDPEVCQRVCENPSGCSNIAYPKLILEIMPKGLKGLMLAAMMAFLMSTLTSVFNSTSTIITMDIWRRIRTNASEGELLVVGRVFVLVMVAITILWLPILQAAQNGQLYIYIQSMTGYLTPPVIAVYLLAVLWKRTNEPGAFWGLIVGLVVGVIRMALDFGYGSPGCGEPDTRPAILSQIHFLHFTIILFVTTLLTTVIVSVMTKPMDVSKLKRLTWWTRHEEDSEYSDMAVGRHLTATDDAHIDIELTAVVKELPVWKRAVFLVCGYERPDAGEVTMLKEAEKQKQLRKFRSIKESPKWTTFVNVNAVILIAVVAFLWGFYA